VESGLLSIFVELEMTLTEAFWGLPDARTGPAQRHDLREMILMMLCAVFSIVESAMSSYIFVCFKALSAAEVMAVVSALSKGESRFQQCQ
jgi:hypothetical protein